MLRDSWHRFSGKKKSHGWCDFMLWNVLELKSNGFLTNNDTVTVKADVFVLDETVSFSSDDGMSGKFTWKVHNFSQFKDMIKTQKITSPIFPAGDCNLRISVYQSVVGGVEHLSLCLESKDTEKISTQDRSSWCLFRMSVLNQKPGLSHMHRESYGRFAADNKHGDSTSLGWNDYMKMKDFLAEENGYLVGSGVVFSTSYNVIKECCSFTKSSGLMVGGRMQARKSDGNYGKFTWRIENFTRLKEWLKKKKLTSLCVKSRKFQIGNRDCRLIVYPRGQSQPPCHLSVFLEVTDSCNTNSNNDWSCFVSQRLSIINQKMEDRCVIKESQNRYSKAAKDWGWREFMTLTNLFDQEYGFIIHDTVIFSAEVLILKETNTVEGFGEPNSNLSASVIGSQICTIPIKGSFIWKVENFLSFKEIIENRKIFSKFFQTGGCELRIGVYESFDTICIYLESDQSSGNDPDKNYWVKYRMAVQNQKNPAKTVWKEFSILTKTWNSSVLQFMKVSDMLDPDAGFIVRDTIIFVCDIIDSFPWFDFAGLEVLSSSADPEALSTDHDEYVDYEESESYGSGDEEDMFQDLLSRAGFHLTNGGKKTSHLKVNLRDKNDTKSIVKFLAALKEYLDDPTKVKRLFLPTKSSRSSKKCNVNNDTNSPSLIEDKVIRQAIVNLLLNVMVECCQTTKTNACSDPCSNRDSTSSEHSGDNEISEYSYMHQRLDSEANEPSQAQAIQSLDLNTNGTAIRRVPQIPIFPQTTVSEVTSNDTYVRCKKTKWPEQFEELISLIVKSLGTLDYFVPQECSVSRIRPLSLQKILLVLDNIPIHLQADLLSALPKLIDLSEHTSAACQFLSRLQIPGTLPSSQLAIFGALCQLDIDSELWERVFSQALKLLTESNDEALPAALEIVAKAALRCHHLPQAAIAVRLKLKSLGTNIPRCLLDVLPNIMHNCSDVAKAILCDIDSNCEVDESFSTESGNVSSLGVNGVSAEEMNTANGFTKFSDALILMEMLSVPNLFLDAAQVFEKAIVRGAIGLRSVSIVLDWRHSMGFSCTSSHVEYLSVRDKPVLLNDKDMVHFTSLLLLCKELSHSKNSGVHDFVKKLYAVAFKLYSEEQYRTKMLNVLIHDAIISSNDCQEANIDMDVLAFLVREDGFATSVMKMTSEIVKLIQSDKEALWNKVCKLENEKAQFQLERNKEQSDFSNEKDILKQRLSDSETANSCLQHELKAQAEHFAKEKKDFSYQLNEFGKQLEWAFAEKEEESKRFHSEHKVLQDRIRESETQLAQLRRRKHDDQQRFKKEKSELAERLKNSEAARLRTEDGLKNCINELRKQDEARRLLEDEVKRLKNIVEQTEHDKREKEVQVTEYETYICDMNEWKVNTKQYIQNLEEELENERRNTTMILYGEGMESLPMDALDQLRNIHETRLRHVNKIIQQRNSSNISPFGLNMF